MADEHEPFKPGPHPPKPRTYEEMDPEEQTSHRNGLFRTYINNLGDKSTFNGVSHEDKATEALKSFLVEHGSFDFYGYLIHLLDGEHVHIS